MTPKHIFITGAGIVTPAGAGTAAHLDFIRSTGRYLRPASFFSASSPSGSGPGLPAGEIDAALPATDAPRPHLLALMAAEEAMKGRAAPPDAVVMGGTTGGMETSEALLKAGNRDAGAYRYHGTGSVTEFVAGRVRCRGPALTVSTACSSGTAAVALALVMLKTGEYRRVLAGGCDSLCRLTYFGFSALQLIDPEGARPLDLDRRGMSVAEGAALVLLEACEHPPKGALARVAGAGLSCDAYHPARPHPEGRGAGEAMKKALDAGGLHPSDIDYINLHGTGTPENDRSEARAVKALFGENPPPVSSVKGALGHSLAASGAVETVLCALALKHGVIPANPGFRTPDPELELVPEPSPRTARIRTALSNSFGFGGNNASVVLTHPHYADRRPPASSAFRPLFVRGAACLTGAGFTDETLNRLEAGKTAAGCPDMKTVSKALPPRSIRRLKRLPRMVLALAEAARPDEVSRPDAVFFSTGWGSLSETHDFLGQLFESGEKFAGPTNFIGSVHNAPAGQTAIHYGSKGPNLTFTGGACSFEQALMAASLMTDAFHDPALIAGADEYHDMLTPLFDPPVSPGSSGKPPADGGGAFWVQAEPDPNLPALLPAFFAPTSEHPDVVRKLIRSLGGAEAVRDGFGEIWAGLSDDSPADHKRLFDGFLAETEFSGRVRPYLKDTGRFASASAAAAALASAASARIFGETNGKGILLLGLGKYLTAFRILPGSDFAKTKN